MNEAYSMSKQILDVQTNDASDLDIVQPPRNTQPTTTNSKRSLTMRKCQIIMAKKSEVKSTAMTMRLDEARD
jgi:hypothetical protein